MYCRIMAGLLSVGVCTLQAANTVVSTGQYDSYRTGSNLNEKSLKVDKIDVHSFGRIGAYAVDGEVFAQPLYVSGQKISSRKGPLLDVLYVATMHNSIYAFDAGNPDTLLWKVNFGLPVRAKIAGGRCPDPVATGPELGILSTPVIDLQSNTIYAVYAVPGDPPRTYAHHIAALDMLTGEQRPGSPTKIVASVPGTAVDSVNGVVSLNGTTHIQRPALTLANGSVYAAFASCGPDPDPFHGWVIGYSAANVALQTSVWNSTPNGSEGGIWQSGRGLVVDEFGSMYGSTGNGTNFRSTELSDSVVKFGLGGLAMGSFTDPHAPDLTTFDLDLSSGGPLYTGSSRLLLAGGKEGVLHVLNPLLIGGPNSLIQSFQASASCGPFTVSGCFQIHSLAFWDSPSNPLLYVWGKDDVLRSYRLSGGKFNTKPDSQNTTTAPFSGGSMALSANGKEANSGVLWAITLDGVLHAYEAINVANELYNSNQNPARDALGHPTHFATPTIAEGKVFVPTTDKMVQVYGLLSK